MSVRMTPGNGSRRMTNPSSKNRTVRLLGPQVSFHAQHPNAATSPDRSAAGTADSVNAGAAPATAQTASTPTTSTATTSTAKGSSVPVETRSPSDVTPADHVSAMAGITQAALEQIERLSVEPRDVISTAALAIKVAETLPGVMAAAYFTRGQNNTLSVAAHNWDGFLFKREEFRREIVNLCGRIALAKNRQSIVLANTPGLITHCLPLNPEQPVADVLAVSVTSQTAASSATTTSPEGPASATVTTAPLHASVELLVGSLRTWHARRDAAARQTELQTLAALTELVSMTDQAVTLFEACQSVGNEMQKLLGCRRVAVGVGQRSRAGAELKSISGVTSFDPVSDLSQCFQAACDETIVRETLAAWPPLNPNGSHTTLALKRVAEQQNVEAVIGVPLTHKSEPVAVLILTGSRTELLEQTRLHLLRAAAPLLGSALFQARRIEGGRLSRLWWRLKTSRWSARMAIGGLMLAAAAVLLMPSPYRMHVKCTVEPLTRRIVSAPYDGVLESALIEPGSVVRQGDTLARMDAREIRWELSSVNAERSQARKEFDIELAQEHIAKAQLARMESERLKRKLELLQYREQNHELTAPIDGMILNGGQDKLTGAPVKMGQPLFEVAELSPLRLELDVPADDYFHVRPGQSVTVTFNGCDGQEFTGTIQRIRQRSEVRSDRNVFVAEMEIENADLRLRPGIQGQATISGDRHSVAWNTFHKAWDALWKTSPTTLLSGSSGASGFHPADTDGMLAGRRSDDITLPTNEQIAHAARLADQKTRTALRELNQSQRADSAAELSATRIAADSDMFDGSRQ